MQVLTRERTWETRGANPLLPWGSTTPPPPGQSNGIATAGVVVSEHSALQLAAVYGSVSIICDSIATLPIRQYKATGMTTAVEMDPAPVIQQPWPEITQRDFITQGTASHLLRGNIFGDITAREERLMFPSQVRLVHPDHAKVRRLNTGQIETSYWNKVVSADNVTRSMALSVPEGLVGLNPIEYMRNVLGLARAQDLYGGSFFANSAMPDGVIQVEGDLDIEEAKSMKQAWLEAHQGINHAHLPAVLTGGATFKPITMTSADAQFLEQMQYSASAISGMIYRVPPHMIGMVTKDTSWGCLPGETLVFTTTGPKPVKDVEVGDEVWSLGDSGMEPQKVVAHWASGTKPLLTFHTAGRTIRATENHHMVVRRWIGPGKGGRLPGGEYRRGRWETMHIDASGVRVGDYFIIPTGFGDGSRTMAPNGRSLTAGAMELMGLYTGDGCRGGSNQVIICHGEGRDGDHIDHYKAVIADEFGVEARTDRAGRQTRFGSRDAVELLETGFTGTAHTKRVPGWVFRLTPELQLAFLRGYLDSDGSVQRGRIVYSSANKALLEDVRHLCIGLGVPVGRVCFGRPAGPMTIDGRTYMARIKWQLSLSSLEFNSRIGSNSPHKAERFIDTPTQRRLCYSAPDRPPTPRGRNKPAPDDGWDKSGCVFQRVRKIERSDLAEPVFDLTVSPSHTLVAGGILIGQSGIEQQELGYVRNTLLIWLNRWEDLMTSWLPPGQFVMFDLSQRLRGDTLQRFAAYQIARVIGSMNAAEVREAEGLPPVTGPEAASLESYTTPLNSSPMPAGPGEGGDKAN